MRGLGLDMAATGAAAVVRDGHIRHALSWKQYTRKDRKVYDMRIWVGGDQVIEVNDLPSLHAVGLEIGEWSKRINPKGLHIAAEESYTALNIKSALSQSRTVGMLLGPLDHRIGSELLIWCKAVTWRNRIGLKKAVFDPVLDVNQNTGKPYADVGRRQWKRMVMWWAEKYVKGYPEAFGAMGGTDDLAEACALATAAPILAAEPPKPKKKRKKKPKKKSAVSDLFADLPKNR